MLRFGSILPFLLSILSDRHGVTDRRGARGAPRWTRAQHRLAALPAIALLLALAPGCAEDPAGSDDRSGDAIGQRHVEDVTLTDLGVGDA